MDNVCWGIIGCGNVCEVKSGPAFYKIEHSSLQAVMRRDRAKLQDFAQRHRVNKYYTDVEQLINDSDIDIVYIATPPNSHKEYTIKVLEAGKPVYVEKPMAMNYGECLEMIEASNHTKQKLFVAYYRRALPYFLKVKELIENNLIGKILTVDVKYLRPPGNHDTDASKHTWRVKSEIAGEGYFYDLAPHTLDILDFLLGEIVEASGYKQNLGNFYDVADTITSSWKFSSGILGSGLWCFIASKEAEQDTITIVGTEGKICFNTFAFKPIELHAKLGVEYFQLPRPEHIQQPLIKTIVDELRGMGSCPSTGISAARTSKVMDMILK